MDKDLIKKINIVHTEVMSKIEKGEWVDSHTYYRRLINDIDNEHGTHSPYEVITRLTKNNVENATDTWELLIALGSSLSVLCAMLNVRPEQVFSLLLTTIQEENDHFRNKNSERNFFKGEQ